jgi:glycosyltransferase involved in cell wall biosynthesis
MSLNILIPTVPQRAENFNNLLRNLYSQIDKLSAFNRVEILFDNDKPEREGGKPTGEKRNELLMRARGEYIWFIDDDDEIYPWAIEEVLKASETSCDVMAINGDYTVDGAGHRRWFIALGNPYEAAWIDGHEVYLRYPNHITPMKRTLVNKFRFPLKSNFEDKEWADQIKEAGVLKTETLIDKPLYHYKYISHDKLY